MTQDDKKLLLEDLSARLPYQPYILIKNEEKGVLESITVLEDGCFAEVWWDGFNYDIEKVKPYLRPMSSMTEEESKYFAFMLTESAKSEFHYAVNASNLINFLVSHYFDFRGLIPKDLAIEAPKDMYKTK